MMSAQHTQAGRARRKRRIRKKVSGTATHPRLSVFRSARHIYAQVVDDAAGCTLASASTLVGHDAQGDKRAHAKAVGERLAKACLDKGIEQVVFDRNGFRYHGRVRALADAAREAGLRF
ncbi:MAG: 50S ribosomal protein L18 [Myxococcales bacterium]|nr:50S ribosomal protein L18 [Myxococcales bacterium]